MKKSIILGVTACLAAGIWIAVRMKDAPDKPQTTIAEEGDANSTPVETPAVEKPSAPILTRTPSAVSVNKQPDEHLETSQTNDVESVIARDTADALNAEVREKEARLRQLSEQLRKGLTPDEVVQIMGAPDVFQERLVETNFTHENPTALITNLPYAIRSNLVQVGFESEKLTIAWRASAAALGLGIALTIPPRPACAVSS